MKQRFVLDAWAFLAFLQNEQPAASRLRQLLEEAGKGTPELFVSTINIGEVYYRVGRVKGEQEADKTLELIRLLPVMVLPASEDAVLAATRLKMSYPISYADAFAGTAAAELGAVLVTGDPELIQLEHLIPLEMLRR